MVYGWTKLTFTANLGKRWCGFFSALSRYAQMTSSEFKLEKLSILPNFYFREVFEQLKPNTYANFHFERVLRFVIEYAWISELLRGAALTWQRGKMSCKLKNWRLMFWKPTICWSPWYCMEWWQDGMSPWFQVSAKERGLGRVFVFPFSPHPFPFLRQNIILGS